MPTRDIHNTVKTYSALDLQEIDSNTTTEGNIIDTQGYEGIEFILHSGDITDGVYVPVIMGGDDPLLADAEEVPVADLIGTTNIIDTLADQRPSYGTPVVDPIADATFVAADDNTTKRIGTKSAKRYFRLDVDSTGTTTGGFLSAIAVLGWAHVNPTPKDE